MNTIVSFILFTLTLINASDPPDDGFGFKVCSKEIDPNANTKEDFTIIYQMGMELYSCDPTHITHGYDAFYTCKSTVPIGNCFERNDFVQINMVSTETNVGMDDVCIDGIIYDGELISVLPRRIGDDAHHGNSPETSEGIEEVYKRRYDVDNGVASHSLPSGYGSLELGTPECSSTDKGLAPITCTQRNGNSALGVNAKSTVSCQSGETMVSCGISGTEKIAGAMGLQSPDGGECTAMSHDATRSVTAVARCCSFGGAVKRAFTVSSGSSSTRETAECPSNSVLTGCDVFYASGEYNNLLGSFAGDEMVVPQTSTWIPTQNRCTAGSRSGTEVTATAHCLEMNDEFELECSTQATYTNRFGFVGCEDGYTQMSCNTWTTSATLDAYYFKNDRCYIQQDNHRDQYANGICCRLREREPEDIPPKSDDDDTVDDAMSFIFLSDVEHAYRMHFGDKAKNLINWISDIGSEGYTFDGEFASFPVEADLVIHGGDVSDLAYGTWSDGATVSSKGDKASDHLYSDHWQQLYDAGIPMISALGNHDFDTNGQKTAEPNKFVSQSYAKSKNLMGNDFEYKEFKNTHDENGPSLFVSDFEGVQIVNLNHLANSLEYDDQYNALSEAMDDSKTTLFFGHYPIAWGMYAPLTGTIVSRSKTLINRFDGKAKYFCGHAHVRRGPKKIGFSNSAGEEYVAAYAHPNWEDGDGTGVYHEAGLYAILVSPTKGILQVKNIHIPDSAYGCWADGTFCLGGICNNCCRPARDGMGTLCGGKKWSAGTLCGLGTTCGLCQKDIGANYWWSKAMTACGEEPRWGDGTICVGDACGVCRNEATFWHGKVHMACGSEPKWGDGTVCLAGTSCNACKNEATWWHGKFGMACGKEPCWGDGTTCLAGTTCSQCCNEARTDMGTKCGGNKWGDGTVCGLGTTCNFCQNKATWWPGRAFTACGSEPCWGRGTVCLTCGQCCGGHKWEWSKFALVCQ